jgi:ERF superfamily
MQPVSMLPERSEKYDVVLTQLMKAKSEMGSAVKKDSSNPFHKSKYASLGAHLELSEAVLFKHGLLMLHTPNIINGVHVLIATIDHPESGQWVKAYLPLPNPKGDSQGIGASITYMRRYSINSMLGLNAEDDDGETASGRGKYDKQAPKQNAAAPTQSAELVGNAEVSFLNILVEKLDKESTTLFMDWIKNTFKASTIQEIPKNKFEQCVTTLNRKIKYLNDQNKSKAVA